jgi:hypothetical protein
LQRQKQEYESSTTKSPGQFHVPHQLATKINALHDKIRAIKEQNVKPCGKQKAAIMSKLPSLCGKNGDYHMTLVQKMFQNVCAKAGANVIISDCNASMKQTLDEIFPSNGDGGLLIIKLNMPSNNFSGQRACATSHYSSMITIHDQHWLIDSLLDVPMVLDGHYMLETTINSMSNKFEKDHGLIVLDSVVYPITGNIPKIPPQKENYT